MMRFFMRRVVRLVCLLPWLLIVGVAAAQAPAAQDFGPQALEQMRVLQLEKSQLPPHRQKIDSQLRRMLDALSPSPKYPELASIEHPVPQADGTIALDIDTFAPDDVKIVVDAVEAAGGTIIYPSSEYKTVRVKVAPAAIDGLALLPGVRFIQAAGLALTNKVNTSEGDVTHRAAAARLFFGFDGTGVKVCVLSDGVTSIAASVASGDLPPGIDVLAGQAGSGDEGTAMLEIVHDLAPGAALGFATAFISEASFAANIVALKNAGCKIIVDDVGYFHESPFQDLDVSDAVNQVTAAGVLYFSSAANSGNLDHGTSGTWEGDFNPNGAIVGLPAGTTAHNFGDGGKSVVSSATSSNPLTLHWNDKFGQSADDYDLYVMDSGLTMILKSSTNVQTGTQDPYEFISGGTTSGQRIVVVQHSGAANRVINLATNRGRLAIATAGNTRGHNATANTVGVAATPAHGPFGAGYPTGPFPNPFNATNTSELFTSDGPRRMYFDFAGNFLPGAPAGNFTYAGGVLLQKPDITAADGVMTAAPGFNPFYGTSAAAPHAAAIAALVKQAFPTMTNVQIRTALGSAAIDIEAPGWDRVTGKGIAMAYETLQFLGAVPSANVTVGTITPTQVAGNGDAFVDPGEDWKYDITLTNAGGSSAFGVVATLTSNTPGVVVTSPPVNYPSLAAGASAPNPAGTPFRFSVTSAACGTAASFTLTVTYGGGTGAPTTMIIPVTIGGLGSTSTFSYSAPAVPIPDATTPEVPGVTATANLVVAGLPAAVGDVKFRFDGSACTATAGATTVGVDHTWIGDLVFKLVAPDGITTTTLVNRMGGINNNGHNLCQLTLDDASAGIVIDSVAVGPGPFTGSFKPSAPLATFLHTNGNGTWKLQANDWEPGDSGNIRAFSLDIRPLACAAAANPTNITATKTVAGAMTPGGTIAYKVTLTNTGTGAQVDNPGDEFTDTLPPQLTLQTVSASSGAPGAVGNTAKWNGSIPGGGTVTITITATINAGTTGATVSNQATVHFDPNHSGTNSSTVLSDDPGVVGLANPTSFVVAAATGAPRTFVASTGNDANPCTLTSPCRSLGAALALTIADGEVVVVDSAGYGPVVLNKAVTVVAPPGVYAGISVSSGHGVDVDPGAGTVVLRGLVLNGLGGDVGINLMSGNALYIENCVISGFTNTGVNAVPSSAATVFVRDSTIRGNAAGAIFGTTAGASGVLNAQIERTHVENNSTIGIGFTSNSATASIDDSVVTGSPVALNVNPTVGGAITRVTVRKSSFAGAVTSGVRVGGAAGTTAVGTLVKSQVSESGTGLELLTGGTAYLSDTSVVRNTTGIAHVSGAAVSLGDNRLAGNGANGTFTSTVSKQ